MVWAQFLFMVIKQYGTESETRARTHTRILKNNGMKPYIHY